MLFTPWCDQGLGVQGRTYVHWLQCLGYRVCVFACQPSKRATRTSPPGLRASSEEWQLPEVKVFECAANREAVPPAVVAAYAQEQGCSDAMLLELCHPNIFRITEALADAGVRVYGVPNIEMVRRSEVPELATAPFAAFLCPTVYAQERLTYCLGRHDSPTPVRLLPTALPEDPRAVLAQKPRARAPVRFLLVGGMNATRRKRAPAVIKAFREAFKGRPDLASLTVLAQGCDLHRSLVTGKANLPHNISIVHKHLTYEEVLRMYAAHHVVILVSRAEGIGLGFYEAARQGLAVITLNVANYNRVVYNERTGWLLDGRADKPVPTGGVSHPESPPMLIGNPEPVVYTYDFKEKDLSALLQQITGNTDRVAVCQAGARRHYDETQNQAAVTAAWSDALSLEIGGGGQ